MSNDLGPIRQPQGTPTASSKVRDPWKPVECFFPVITLFESGSFYPLLGLEKWQG